MGKGVPQLTTLVRQKASVEASQVVTDDEVVSYLNEKRASLHDLMVSVDPSYYESHSDYTLASSPTGAAGALPADFYRLRGVVRYPDTTREYPVYLSPFNERRRGRVGYTLDGDSLTIVPYDVAGDGPWRIYYTPKAPQFGYDFTVAATTVTALPSYSFGSGILTATSNGALVVDGVTNPATVAVKNEASTGLNSFYVLTQAGDGSHPWILTIGAIGAGFRLKTAAGTFNGGKYFTFSTAPVANAWLEQTLDVTEDNFDEYLTNGAAMAVFAKRQMDPGLVPGMFSAAEQRVRAMASGRASEPEQAPILWRGRARRDWEDDC